MIYSTGRREQKEEVCPPPHATLLVQRKTWCVQQRTKIADGQRGVHVTHLHTCRGATQVLVRLAPVQDYYSFDSSTRRIGIASQVLRLRVRSQLSQSRCLSLLVLMKSTSSFLHAAIDLRPPSITVPTHTSASNAVVPNPPLCQSNIHFYSCFWSARGITNFRPLRESTL